MLVLGLKYGLGHWLGYELGIWLEYKAYYTNTYSIHCTMCAMYTYITCRRFLRTGGIECIVERN